VAGRSLGGLCALHVAAAGDPPLDGLVVESAGGDLDAFVRSRGFDPLRDVTDRDRDDFCPLRKAHKTLIPTLIIHGASDTLVDPANAQRIFEASAASDKTLVLVPECGHNDIFLGPQYWSSLSAFVRKLAGRSADAS
jgi:alpha-beta hydrolase superfamily lysophospholipase